MFNFSIPELLSRAIILLIVFPAHELAHAVTATWMGDPTPRLAGRLTLNPFKHIQPLGAIMLLLFGFGWASTPINPAYFGSNARIKLGVVSFSGPLTNFALALLTMIPFLIFGWLPTSDPGSTLLPSLPYFLTVFMGINLMLAVFNLLPIKPLDGADVLGAFLHGEAAVWYDRVQQYGMIALMLLLFVLPQFGIHLLDILISLAAQPLFGLLGLLLRFRLQM